MVIEGVVVVSVPRGGLVVWLGRRGLAPVGVVVCMVLGRGRSVLVGAAVFVVLERRVSGAGGRCSGRGVG